MTIFKIFTFILLFFIFLISLQQNPRKIMGREIYTSSQPGLEKMDKYISKYKIKTVLNLRGENKKEWYFGEKKILEKRGVSFYSIRLSANRIIPRYEILKVLYFYENLKYPVLIHCKHGFDRSYFFASLLMKFEEREIEKRYFFKPQIWNFFKEYEEYLKVKGLKHKREVLIDYIKNEYTPEKYRYDLIFERVPKERDRNLEFEIKVINRSRSNWIFKNSKNEGIRLGVLLFGPFDIIPQDLEKYFYEGGNNGREWGRIGMEEREVFPGGEKHFKFSLPLPDEKGKYFFAFDMVDENVSWFYYYGKAPHFYAFEVN